MGDPRSEPPDRPATLGGVELALAGVLAAGVVLGLVVWAKWGFLVAFDAVVTYGF